MYDEYYEIDQAWLLQYMPEATENQIDAFCEKVAELCCNTCHEEEAIRQVCLDMLLSGEIG